MNRTFFNTASSPPKHSENSKRRDFTPDAVDPTIKLDNPLRDQGFFDFIYKKGMELDLKTHENVANSTFGKTR